MSLTPPYRVIAGRGIVDARNRLVAHCKCRQIVDIDGFVQQSYEAGGPLPPGLSPEEADMLTHEIVAVLNRNDAKDEALNKVVHFLTDEQPITQGDIDELLVTIRDAKEGRSPEDQTDRQVLEQLTNALDACDLNAITQGERDRVIDAFTNAQRHLGVI